MTMSEEQAVVKLSLYQKISKVMEDVRYLQKDDHISFGKTNYKAISEEKVTSKVRESLIKHGLVILPVEQQYQRNGNLGIVEVKYKIVDIDTGDSEILTSVGEGADSQDKASGKALTYSYKYLLLRTFAIPTGEDPDKISSAELDNQQEKIQEARQAVEFKANQAIMELTRRGHNPAYLQQVCIQAVGPFSQLGDLNINQLNQINNLLDAQLQQPVAQ